VYEVRHQQVGRPAPFLSFAKGPRQEVSIHDHLLIVICPQARLVELNDPS